MIPTGLKLEAKEHVQEVREEALSELESDEGGTDDTSHEPNWVATIGVGIIFVLIGMSLIGVDPEIGAVIALFGFILIGASYFSAKEESAVENERLQVAEFEQMESERELKDAVVARKVARQQEVEEIIRAVKQTIRVRCRYCGTLNEETANKCESCGASL